MHDINKKIIVSGTKISVVSEDGQDYLSLTEMLKAKDGDFFIADWLRNRNTVEFLGIWESINNPDFNYGEFAIIKSQVVKEVDNFFMTIHRSKPRQHLCFYSKCQ
jgi:hypothetical protein